MYVIYFDHIRYIYDPFLFCFPLPNTWQLPFYFTSFLSRFHRRENIHTILVFVRFTATSSSMPFPGNKIISLFMVR